MAGKRFPLVNNWETQSSHVAESRAARLNYRRVANLRLNAYFRTQNSREAQEATLLGPPFLVLWKNTFRLEVRLSAN